MRNKSDRLKGVSIPFEGFSARGFRFFKELEANNNRDWFASHREEYAVFVAGPMKALAATLTPVMYEIDGLFEMREGRVLSRPHRDTRFSKDKSPYHTAAWLLYRRPGEEGMAAPAYYFEISKKGFRYGMGFYSALPKTMQALRAAIDENEKHFRSIFAKIEKAQHLQLAGEVYARKIPNSHVDWFQPYYQRRNLYFIHEEKTTFARKDAISFSEQLMGDFKILAPAYRYFLELA